ncbi:acyl-CoA thioester hydrolase/BAAT C-terminal domain-containing protein [Erythrobacter litoralis]|uniref:Dienelactone hydrolase family protein n=1 Tax=Erythrobacter litoralis (strain HTCC2594) TaxID=314225 RepID=Q2N9J1_ERYLH|nr:acyl-CoA thioester hydrolase/BAAT C-terminal domain-containing protein [Erythrobacter litoralis]ABC63650.1 dienelactone hydrolase family protein [Erythrobacter litoralis HTCC2594]
MKIRHLTAAIALAIVAPIPASAEPVAPTEIIVGQDMPGAFFAVPEGTGPFPAIILLGGSEGGDSTARRMAPRFLAQGYAIFGLPYYSPAWGDREQQFPALSDAFDGIAIEKAEMARAWLAERDEVRADDIGIWGVSKGGEFALLAGSYLDGFAAIAAIVPSDVVWEGWGPGRESGTVSSFSWQGEPLPFVPYEGMAEEFANPTGPNGRARLRLPHDRGRNANPDRAVAARIPVERIDEPVLVAGGDADLVWNSGEMAQIVAERRAAAGLPTVSLIFTDAGHSLSGDGTPNPYSNDEELSAQRIVWPATLEFFATYLKD